MSLPLDHNDDDQVGELDLKANIQNEAFAHLRKESLDLFNRLHSIEEDINFVEQVHNAYPSVPLLPNLRCGAWYTPPDISAPYPAYFKSTDGHTSNWKFNLRRPNLHLLPLIAQSGGLVLVDSTRAGKRIPDALSKTVPIWCAVINAAILLRFSEVEKEDWDVSLHTPPTSVSRQEHDQIEKLLADRAKALNNSTYTLPKLARPLRPIWITPASTTFPRFDQDNAAFLPIICVSASRQVESGMDRRTGGFVYVQGSGDDHELWGMGLTPSIFWANRHSILSTSRAEVNNVVSSLVLQSKSDTEQTGIRPTEISKVNDRLHLGALNDVHPGGDDDAYVLISHQEYPGSDGDVGVNEQGTTLRIFCPAGKKGQMHFLQVVLPRSMEFIHSCLSQGLSVCIACPTGNDLGVGVAVAALQKFFTVDGKFVGAGLAEVPDKSTIRTRLEWIISDRPEANPSRNTLKRVNEYLLSSTAFRVSSTKK
ncbi:trna a64-2 -o-ribosylphosphate transferase [Moniliophthora roreri MCA 2997]|uniref:Trna a64-2-o-ribosylphosphate transferase n=1 Tax=Moniliophthora roreri (strain MCA 2997) TaxID=1381753 RepID=V2XTW4_MONRO|nr:trna a64-2 -o-ribosylphosphate transferase [Moniliophthora roreri MCA 2997]